MRAGRPAADGGTPGRDRVDLVPGGRLGAERDQKERLRSCSNRKSIDLIGMVARDGAGTGQDFSFNRCLFSIDCRFDKRPAGWIRN